MKLLSYLAEVQMYNPRTGEIFYEQKRVVPTMHYIMVDTVELPTGYKTDIIELHDEKKIFKYVLIYVDVSPQKVGDPIMSGGYYGTYALPFYQQERVKIIPETEEFFETEIETIKKVEDYFIGDPKALKKMKKIPSEEEK